MKHTASLIVILTCFTFSSSAQHNSLPYFDDFESGAPGWMPYVIYQSGTNWELGTPTSGFTVGAFSGNNCWDVNLNSVYSNYAVSYLSSPIFNFSNVAQAHISFWTKYNAEYLWDYMAVQYTVDKGDSWLYMPFPNLINPDGNVQKWIHSSLTVNDLLGYATVQFRFVFVSDGSIAYDGYSIDDFRIELEALSSAEINQQTAFSFFPNPSFGNVTFDFSTSVENDATITIYNAEGKNVLHQKVTAFSNSANLDLHLSNGIYSVVLNNNDSRVVKKLVLLNK